VWRFHEPAISLGFEVLKAVTMSIWSSGFPMRNVHRKPGPGIPYGATIWKTIKFGAAQGASSTLNWSGKFNFGAKRTVVRTDLSLPRRLEENEKGIRGVRRGSR
jgi:hypothetical protein